MKDFIELDKNRVKLFIAILFWIVIGFVAGFIMCYMITNNYLESAQHFMQECINNATNITTYYSKDLQVVA